MGDEPAWLMGVWYDEFADLDYKPSPNELIALFYLEPPQVCRSANQQEGSPRRGYKTNHIKLDSKVLNNTE